MTANVNYTAEQVETMVARFKAGTAIETIAEEIGKSTRSVIAKLSREGVYVAKVKSTPKSERVTKADLVAKIAAKYEVEAKALESLEKASKEALEILAA